MRTGIFNHLAALALAAGALLASGAVWADPPGRVGRIGEFSGTVWMFDAEQGEWTAAQRNRPLTSGDRLSAERDARAELQIGSAMLRLDSGTELEVTELDDARVRVHLHNGSLALRLRSNASAREFAVTTAEGQFEPQSAGHYRIDRRDDGSFGGVITGAMRFEARDSALELAAGQRAELWSERGVTHYSWSQLPDDRFAEWVAQQEGEYERAARSNRYVSPEMTGAEDLYRYGEWDRHPEYGALWLPTMVAPGWAPYRYGHWAYVRPWGWTWIDDAPWGFAPFHYGRWVWWRDRWGWAPGQYVARPVYAPALVAWIGGPNFSIGINLGGPAVGWVPLSPREHYRPTYAVTNVYITNVNSPHRRWQPPMRPNQPVRTGPIMYTNQGVPGGVTVVPQQVLRERKPISNAVIAPVDAGTIQRWQSQPAPSGSNETSAAERATAAAGAGTARRCGAWRRGAGRARRRARHPLGPGGAGAARERAGDTGGPRGRRRCIAHARTADRSARQCAGGEPRDHDGADGGTDRPRNAAAAGSHCTGPAPAGAWAGRAARATGPTCTSSTSSPTGAAGAAGPAGARRSPGAGPGTGAGPGDATGTRR